MARTLSDGTLPFRCPFSPLPAASPGYFTRFPCNFRDFATFCYVTIYAEIFQKQLRLKKQTVFSTDIVFFENICPKSLCYAGLQKFKKQFAKNA